MDITGNEIPSQNVAGREPTLDLHVKNKRGLILLAMLLQGPECPHVFPLSVGVRVLKLLLGYYFSIVTITLHHNMAIHLGSLLCRDYGLPTAIKFIRFLLHVNVTVAVQMALLCKSFATLSTLELLLLAMHIAMACEVALLREALATFTTLKSFFFTVDKPVTA